MVPSITMRMDKPAAHIQGHFSTSDFWLAGSLVASGHQLMRLDWVGPKASFVFQNEKSCQQASNAYWDRDLKVDAKEFTDALRTLKDRLYENGNGKRDHPYRVNK